MRIIAGEFRGRRLLPPESDATRPITDRAKQSLFDILSPRLEGAAILDLFAGTGSMGLECLSRGARQATFFEMDRSALARLRTNINTLGVASRATVRAGDLFKSAIPPAELVFLDPPYRFLRERPADLHRLASQLPRTALVIFRHDSADTLDLPPFSRIDQRQYGSMTIDFLLHPVSPAEARA